MHAVAFDARPPVPAHSSFGDRRLALSWVMTIPGGSEMDEQRSKTITESEPLRCADCGEAVTLAAGDPAGACANCGSTALAPLAPAGGTARAPVLDEHT